MERVRRYKDSLFVSLAIAAAALLGACDNPVDMLDEVRVEVMKGNDRFLEVVDIRIPVDSNNLFSPTGTIEIDFDRDIDLTTVTPETVAIIDESGTSVTYPDVGVSYVEAARTLRVRVHPYLGINKPYTLRVSGVRGADGSAINAVPLRSLRTKDVLAGAITELSGTDSYAGYTRSSAVNVKMEVNEFCSYIKYVLSSSNGTKQYSSSWFARPADDNFTLSNFDVLEQLGVPDADGLISLSVSFYGNNTAADEGSQPGTEDTATIIMDRVYPAAPSVPDLSATTDTGISNSDNITNKGNNSRNPIVFSGTAETGSTVRLKNGADTIGTAATTKFGAWNMNVTYGEGTYSIYATATDRAGNESVPSATLPITLDYTRPIAPACSLSVPTYIGRTTAGLVKWSWVSGGSSDSSGRYRYAWGAAPTGEGSADTSLSIAADGAYSELYVQEQDRAGSWSVSETTDAVTISPCIPLSGQTYIAETISSANRIAWRPVASADAYRVQMRSSRLGIWTSWSAWAEIAVPYITSGTNPTRVIIQWRVQYRQSGIWHDHPSMPEYWSFNTFVFVFP